MPVKEGIWAAQSKMRHAEVKSDSQKSKAKRRNQNATRRIKLQFAKLMFNLDFAENASGDSKKVRHAPWELRHAGCASLDSQTSTQISLETI